MTPDRMLEAFRDSTGPDADARTRLMGRLAALGPPAAPTRDAAPPRRAAWPWVAVGALAAAAALALWIAPREQTPIDDAPQPTMASDRAETEVSGGRAIPRTTEPSSAHSPRTPAVAPATEPESPQPPDPAPLEEIERRPTPPPKARRRPAATTSPAASKPDPEPSDEVDTLAEELRLISRARAALSRGDAATALSHLRTHASTFDAPRLGEEAAALRAMARCTRDGPDEASARAFGRTFPTSMFRARVTAACSSKGDHAEPSADDKTRKTSPE